MGTRRTIGTGHSGPARNRTGPGRAKRGGARIKPAGGRWIVLFYSCLVAVHTLIFVYLHGASYLLVLWSFLPGLALGFVLLVYEWGVDYCKKRLAASASKLLAVFLSFFMYLIGYILFFSVVVSCPVGWFLKQLAGPADLAHKYGVYSVNFVIVLAVLSWVGWLKLAAPRSRSGANSAMAYQKRKAR